MNTLSSMLKFLGETLGANPNTLKTTDKTLVGGINGAWEIVYPVGSYYETSDASFDPNVSWGGTWVLEESGKVHIGAGTGYTIGSTGGSSTVTLDLTQIPSHNHGKATLTGYARVMTNNTSDSGIVSISNASIDRAYPSSGGAMGAGNLNVNATHTHSNNGGGQAHNNMQPYIVVNRWHRTA